MSSYTGTHLGFDPLPATLTGMNWKAQLAEQIFGETGDKQLKSVWGDHGWDVGIIDKLVNISAKTLAPGADMVIALKSGAKVTEATAKSFLKNIEKYRNAPVKGGALPTMFNLASKVAEGAGNIADEAPKVIGTVQMVLIILAVGVGGYLVFAGKKGTKLTPF